MNKAFAKALGRFMGRLCGLAAGKAFAKRVKVDPAYRKYLVEQRARQSL